MNQLGWRISNPTKRKKQKMKENIHARRRVEFERVGEFKLLIDREADPYDKSEHGTKADITKSKSEVAKG